MRQDKLRGGLEYDCLTKRGRAALHKRSGTIAAAKRQFNKRARRNAKQRATLEVMQ